VHISDDNRISKKMFLKLGFCVFKEGGCKNSYGEYREGKSEYCIDL